MKRIFDIVCSLLGLMLLSPFFIIIAILIPLDSKGYPFFRHKRVGKNGKDFGMFKFRTMIVGAEKKGSITISNTEKRITRIGRFLRKNKLDELPQLFNVLFGSMSVVGPRPEVREYVDYYTREQMKVLSVKPGITDYASLVFVNENKILGEADDPIKVYIDRIMPIKLRLNQKYIRKQGLGTDIKIIFATLITLTNPNKA